MSESLRNVIVIGSGPAGLTAALYAARANLKPLVIEGLDAGGQLMLTTDVENFPGFPSGIMGPELMSAMRTQAERFGAEFRRGNVTGVDLHTPFTVTTEDGHLSSRTIIISTGASAKLLGLPAERALMGHGVSTCATCDGFFFRSRPIAVVGGGDSAVEEAIFLTRFASSVTLIHRRDTLRASKIMQDKARANPKIAFEWDTEVVDVRDPAAGALSSLRLRNVKTGVEKDLAVDGLFVAIGHTPNTALFKGQLDMDAGGYLVTRDGAKTNVAGVFACGDVQDRVYRQAITAAGSGCMAAIDAERYLEHLGH